MVSRTGYGPDFLGTPAGLPALGRDIEDDALLVDEAEIIDYTHCRCA